MSARASRIPPITSATRCSRWRSRCFSNSRERRSRLFAPCYDFEVSESASAPPSSFTFCTTWLALKGFFKVACAPSRPEIFSRSMSLRRIAAGDAENARPGAQSAQALDEFEPVHARHMHIDDDDVGSARRDGAHRVAAVRHGHGVESGAVQSGDEHFADFDLIVDHQNPHELSPNCVLMARTDCTMIGRPQSSLSTLGIWLRRRNLFGSGPSDRRHRGDRDRAEIEPAILHRERRFHLGRHTRCALRLGHGA